MGLQDPSAELQEWLRTNTYHHQNFSLPQLAEAIKAKSVKVTVIIPGKEVAPFLGGVLDKTVKPLVDGGVVQRVVVIDANSADKTGEVAATHGANVLQRIDIAPELGPSLGKGDAMWRALLATSNQHSCCEKEIIAFLDGDTGDPHSGHLLGITAPLIMNDELRMVRGCFDRPFKSAGGEVRPHEGGRVTELVARPLLNRHFPDLAGFCQPLAGEFAAGRALLEQLTFPVGYGVEVGTLIDTLKLVGPKRIAECDLGTRQNDHKALRTLGTMALAILNTVERRVDRPQVKGHALADMMYLPWEKKNQTVSAIERPAVKEYSQSHKRVRLPAPFVDIPNVLNFRDIGGHPISPGFSVPDRLIYRSADFPGLMAMGTQELQARNIKAVFDLRSSLEIARSRDSGKETEFTTWASITGRS